jgi:hypothetical protein
MGYPTDRTRRLLLRSAFCVLSSAFLLLPLGCGILGFAAAQLPAPTVPARYVLAGETVGVMVWADRGILLDWSSRIQRDLARSVQAKLEEAIETGKVKELRGTTFPVKPESILKFQHDHPEIEDAPVTEVAARLGVNRLIYIELEDFSTRPDGGVELFRGRGEATIRLVEVDPATKQAKVAFEENAVAGTFPPQAPPEGLPSIGDYKTYMGTVDALAAEIAKRFVPHPEEPVR